MTKIKQQYTIFSYNTCAQTPFGIHPDGWALNCYSHVHALKKWYKYINSNKNSVSDHNKNKTIYHAVADDELKLFNQTYGLEISKSMIKIMNKNILNSTKPLK